LSFLTKVGNMGFGKMESTIWYLTRIIQSLYYALLYRGHSIIPIATKRGNVLTQSWRSKSAVFRIYCALTFDGSSKNI
jgi:hypothetical protein